MASSGPDDFAKELFADVAEYVRGHVHVPSERGEEGIEEFGSELFFLVVAGLEDPAVLVEMVEQAFDSVGHGRSHRREDMPGLGRSQVERESRGQGVKVVAAAPV